MTPITLTYTDPTRTHIIATIPDKDGKPVAAGTARRYRIGAWRIRVGHAEQRAFRRRGAVRLLERRVKEALIQGAIRRAQLDTYRPGFDDRLRNSRGWR